jgi:phosphoglycerol transferase MdoB-like AlkP superfamily enzyme
MQKRVIALSIYIVFWLSYFFFARMFFLAMQFHIAFRENINGLLGTFWHGSKLDISTTGYYLILPVLATIPSLFSDGSLYRLFIRWYTYVLIVFSSVITVADSFLYGYWGFRMDYTPVLYLKTPGEAMASVSLMKTLLFFLVIILVASFFIFLYSKLIDRFFIGFDRMRYRLAGILFFMFLCATLIIPIRGGFGVAPINAGSVYFSDKMFLNHAAINSVWNVGSSAFAQNPVRNPYEFGDLVTATTLVDSLTAKRGFPRKVLNINRPNIMIIVLESFSGYLIAPESADTLVTPNFNRLIKEGLYFSRFYASGTRTDKAIPAILDGYPAQPAQSIIKEQKKSQSLSSLVKILIDNGYNSSFWYGGEINFASFNSFVIGSGFQKIITMNNFPPEFRTSKWGVHDHLLFKKLQDSMRSVKEPFLNVVLTLSSHEPFDVPITPVFVGKDQMTKYRNSVYYADKSLGTFIEWAKTTDWWKNTVVVLVADHCARVSEDMPIYGRNVFKIPMLWIGGAVDERGTRVDKLGTQVDIPLTILDQLGIKGNFPFGKDLLSEQSRSFAFYTFNEGFGFITDSSAYFFDQKLKMPVSEEGKKPDYAGEIGKAYLQVLFNDYLKR